MKGHCCQSDCKVTYWTSGTWYYFWYRRCILLIEGFFCVSGWLSHGAWNRDTPLKCHLRNIKFNLSSGTKFSCHFNILKYINNHHHVHEGLGVFSVPWSSRWSWSLHLFLGRPMFLRHFGWYCSAYFYIKIISFIQIMKVFIKALKVWHITYIEVQLLWLWFLNEKEFMWEMLPRIEQRCSCVYQEWNLFQGSSVTLWSSKRKPVKHKAKHKTFCQRSLTSKHETTMNTYHQKLPFSNTPFDKLQTLPSSIEM